MNEKSYTLLRLNNKFFHFIMLIAILHLFW